MNSESEESFQIDDSPQLPPRQAEPGRSRFTLLSDIPQTANSFRQNLQQSPVRMYLRELHEQRLLLEKENNLKQGNRKEVYPDYCPEKDKKQMSKSIHEGDMKKPVMMNQINLGQENLITKNQKIDLELKRLQNERNMKPGIYLYKKKINLAEPAEVWFDLGESFLRSSLGSGSSQNVDFQKNDRLFGQALRQKNHKRF